MTPKKTDTDKKRPGRPPLPPDQRRYSVGFVRLLGVDVERLDRVATEGRKKFMESAIEKAIARAEKRVKA